MFSRIFNSLHKTLLPVAAIIALGFAIFRVWGQQQEQQKLPDPPLSAPADSPYEKMVAGSGIVEPRTEDIFIGTAVPGLAREVFVKVGDVIQPGDKLFRIDERSLEADLGVRRAMLASANASLERLRNMPRKEEIAPSNYKIAEAKSRLADAEDRYKRAQRLVQSKVVTDEQLTEARQAYQTAKEQLGRATSQHELLLAGAWKEDIQVAQAAVTEAQAQIDRAKRELERLEVRAPQYMDMKSYEVLQVKVRPGEYIGTPASATLIVLGNLERLHVRVDIDEHDIPRFRKDAKAIAKLRGDPKVQFPLTFVRVEPYVVPKKSLTGDNTERVDTRVLQVIYALEPGTERVYVGQQMDVFVQGA
ncbi:MAG: HlyD family efflux transporter periplasmic adaptor subunit [Pirellulales bacterium]